MRDGFGSSMQDCVAFMFESSQWQELGSYSHTLIDVPSMYRHAYRCTVIQTLLFFSTVDLPSGGYLASAKTGRLQRPRRRARLWHLAGQGFGADVPARG